MIGELTDHLWQSTVFAVAAALTTMAFRRNRANVRYWLWLSASFKFLVPFSLLMSLGSRMEWAPAVQKIAAAPAISFTMMQMSEPFTAALPLAPPPRGTHDWIVIAILCVWVCGFSAVALMRWRSWRFIRRTILCSTPLNIPASVEIRSSPGLLEPGVVGLFRPILLLPAGIVQRLTPGQLDAVIAHELCHVRRRDNLAAAIHMIAEAVFWFHPLVWWIGARLVEERERACDEAVLSLGSKPHDYAEGILNVCKSYLESPLSCVSGVTGSDLKRRIQAILTGRVACELTFAKKAALAVAAVAAIGAPVAIGIMNGERIQAQSEPPIPKFEVASVKPCAAFRKVTPRDWSPGTLHSQCTTVQRLIQQAFGLFANGHMDQGSSLVVSGGPAWTTSDLYEIEGKAEGSQTHSMMNGPMLQRLLEDRFKLKVHRETRQIPVYALKVAEGGPKLQPFEGTCTPRDFDKPPSDADCGTARGWGSAINLKAATMADLCAGFSVLLDRHVLDETGIRGRFNMHLDLSAESRALLNRPRALPAVSDPTVPAPPPVPFSAAKIAMRKLGLDLESTKGPSAFLLIDHVERPSGS